MPAHAQLFVVLVLLPGALAGCAITPVFGHVYVPEGTTSIAGNAYYQCTALVSVSLPASITSIERNAFASCFTGACKRGPACPLEGSTATSPDL